MAVSLANDQVRSLLGKAKITDKDGNAVSMDSLKNKYIGLYFSGYWCSPCRKMTPILADIYNKRDDFEVIWVTMDGSKSAADTYYKKMPWVRLPYSEAKGLGRDLFNAVKQRYIPTLTMLDSNLNIINYNARSALFSDTSGRNFPWKR